jgi:hypothetical protein
MNFYLIIYVGIGICIGIAMFIYQYRSSSDFERSIAEAIHGRRSWHYRLRERLVIPCTIILIAFCWPLALVLLIKELIPESRKDVGAITEYPFIARNQFLFEEKSLESIEAENIYSDPLDAVPNSPFGHLNSGWELFKSKMTDGDKVRVFKTPKNTTYGKYGSSLDNDVHGYALVRDEEIIAEFIYESN